MDEHINNSGLPEQDPNQSPKPANDQNLVQDINNAESGTTYWESTQIQNPAPGQGTSETTEQFYQNYQQQMGGPAYGQPQSMPVIPPRKKSHKKAIAAVIVVVLLLSAAATAFAFQDKIKNALSLGTKSPQEYYASVEKEAIDDGIDQLMSYMDTYSEMKDMAMDVSADLTYDKDTVSSLLQSSMGMTLADLENSIGIPLDKIGFDMTVAMEDDDIYEKLGLSLNNVDIISAEIFMDYLNKNMLMRVPELSPAYLKQSLDMSQYGVSSFDLDAYYKALDLIASDQTGDFLKRYSRILIDGLTKVELSKNEELKAGNLSVKCNVLTVTIGPEEVSKIAKNVLEEARDDEYLLELVKLYNMSETDYRDAIEEALSEINEAEVEDYTITMDVYVDGSGKILGRNIEAKEAGASLGNLSYRNVSKSDKGAYQFIVGDEKGSELLNISGNHTNTNGSYTGEAVINIDTEGNEMMDISFELAYEDFKTEKKDNKSFTYGSLNLSSYVMMGMEVRLDYDVKGETQMTALSLNMGNTPIITLNASAKYLDGFKIPKQDANAKVYDMLTEINDYSLTMDIEGYLSELSDKLGVDLESLIGNFMPY